VVLTVEGRNRTSYEDILKTARSRISLEKEVGVPSLKIGHTRTGGLI